ncbi:MAG TPA: hypothetical protein VGC41_29790 [Kofleriaceae bacterium]
MVAGSERRHHTRVIAKGAVTFRVKHHELRGRVANLGEGGVWVLTGDPVSSEHLHAEVELEIRLDGVHDEWLRGFGAIVRIGALGVAISFATPSANLLHMIARMSSAARASARVMSVVLIDSGVERRSAMAAGFRAAGCNVIEAGTQLEAIVRLGEISFEPDVIAVADSQSSSADEMRTFIQREHPSVKLVTIGDELFAPDGIAHWLSSTASYVDLPGRIREVLVQPQHGAARS